VSSFVMRYRLTPPLRGAPQGENAPKALFSYEGASGISIAVRNGIPGG